MSAGYRGARSMLKGGAEQATLQRNADKISNKAQRVRKAAETASAAKVIADDHENQISTGVLENLNIGEMALLNRINGELPNRNIATIQDATKIGDGVVAARTLISQDAASFNLWAQNAMIRSAAIETLVADKITGGLFNAGTINIVSGGTLRAGDVYLDSNGARFPAAHIKSASIDTLVADKITGGFFSAGTFNVIAGGAVVAGGARMDSTGFTVPSIPTFSLSSASRENKVGTRTNRASLYFIENDDANGAILQGDTTGGRRGYVGLFAVTDTNNWTNIQNSYLRLGAYDNDTATRSYVEMRAAFAGINGHEYTRIQSNGRVTLEGQNFYVDSVWEPRYAGSVGNVPGNGGWRQWEHGLGYVPQVYGGHWHMGNGQFRPLPSGGSAGLFIDFVSAGFIRVTNNSSSGQDASVFVYG